MILSVISSEWSNQTGQNQSGQILMQVSDMMILPDVYIYTYTYTYILTGEETQVQPLKFIRLVKLTLVNFRLV
jgi:hypothetical protein